MSKRLALLALALAVIAPAVSFAKDFPGASGMAQLDATHYLCVQDVKAHSDKARLGVLAVDSFYEVSESAIDALCNEQSNKLSLDDVELGVKLDYTEVDCDWPAAFGGRSSDLEAVHAILGRPGEYLATESGYWDGKYGRIFHLRVSNADGIWQVSVLRAYQLPKWLPGEVEGIACQVQEDGRALVVLGVRGGTPAYAPGRLYWGMLSANADPPELTFEPDGLAGTDLMWANFSNDPGQRTISDLMLDSAGGLWIAGAEDLGNLGPFRSYVWLGGTVTHAPTYAVQMYRTEQQYWRIDGSKIEAIALPSTPGSPLCFATDDESYGGIWRPLPAAVYQY